MLQRIDYGQITRRLLASGYTTASLARAVGLSQPSISRIATGKTRMVSGDVAVSLIALAGGSVEVPDEVAPEAEPPSQKQAAA